MWNYKPPMYFLKPKRIFDTFNLLPYFKDKYYIAYNDRYYLFFPKSGKIIEREFYEIYNKALSDNLCISFNLKANNDSIKTCKYHYNSIIEDIRDNNLLKAYEYTYSDSIKEGSMEWKKANQEIKNAVYNLEEINKLEGVCKDHLIISYNK